MFLGVLSAGRVSYLDELLRSFFSSIENNVENWSIFIADDSMSAKVIETIRGVSRDFPLATIALEFNQRIGVAAQTNSLLRKFMRSEHDVGFFTNDDITFQDSGWLDDYLESIRETGFQHLVHHDSAWAAGTINERGKHYVSHVDARNCQGAFFTVTKDLIRTIGYFDECSFPYRGHSHVDFTLRACRAGFNNETTLLDSHGGKKLSLQPQANYMETFDWKSDQAELIQSMPEKKRREKILDSPERVKVIPHFHHRNPQAFFLFQSGNQVSCNYDVVNVGLVLNLDADFQRFRLASIAALKAGILPIRIRAIDGRVGEILLDWKRYNRNPFRSIREYRIGRRLLQFPGALGYLHSAKLALQRAESLNLNHFVLIDDDIIPHFDANTKVAKMSKFLFNKDWGLAYLGSSSMPEFKGSMESKEEIGALRTSPNGSFALLVSRSSHELLLRCINKFNSPFDDLPVKMVSEKFDSYAFKPGLEAFVADLDFSRIRTPSSREKKATAHWDATSYVQNELVIGFKNKDSFIFASDLGEIALASTVASIQCFLTGTITICLDEKEQGLRLRIQELFADGLNAIRFVTSCELGGINLKTGQAVVGFGKCALWSEDTRPAQDFCFVDNEMTVLNIFETLEERLGE